MSLRSDDLNSVGELYSKDDFRQLVIAIETTPAFFGGLSELEDHRQRGLVRETSLGSHGPVAHRRERAFDDIGCTQMLPVFGRKVIEGKQCVSILDQIADRFNMRCQTEFWSLCFRKRTYYVHIEFGRS